jgi:two-component system sensor histidine kinase PilS (NtrC family)
MATSGPPETPRPKPEAAPEPLRRRALVVLAVRLAVVGSLLGGSLLLSPTTEGFTPRALLWLIATAFGTTVAFAISLQRGAPIQMVAGAQVALDLGLVTGLVYLTGGAPSGFGSLYAAVVLVAALLLGPRPTLVAAAAALLLYLALGLGTVTGMFSPPPDQPFHPDALSVDALSAAVLRTSVGLLVVAGLAGALSERLSRARGEADRAAEAARGAERFAEDVVRSIASGLITVDLDGRVVTANALAGTLLRRSDAELRGERIEAVLPLEAGTERVRLEATALRGDGTGFPIGLTRTPLLDAGGEVQGALILFTDLSELAALREKAERTERLAVLGRLAAGLAHEIRNPLGSISGSVELVRDGGQLGAEDRRLLELVLEEASRLDELVGTMLSVGRPSVPDRIDADLAAIAREVVEVAKAKAPVPIELTAGDAVHARVDPAQVRQVVWNLLKNALQFSPRGEAVRVRVQGDEQQAVVEVEDRGPGIPEADRTHIFDMFFTKRAHGVGVGLALVKQIVDAHGGRIEVESAEGRGSTFRVVFLERPCRP